MTIEEKVREIMRSEELTNAEKRDQLHSLIPADVFKIDNLNKATPEQLAQLEAGLEIAQALEQINAAEFRNERHSFNSKHLC
jgi:hypothetical protein